MAKKETIKNLTPNELLKQAKVLDEQREFTIEIGGQQYKLTHDVTFRQSKKGKLLEDMVGFFQKASENVDILDLATPYISMLILKHFTSLEVSDDVVEALALLETMIDLNIIGQVISELPQDQLESVYELIARTVNSMADNLIDAQEEAKNLAEKIGDPEMLNLVPNTIESIPQADE